MARKAWVLDTDTKGTGANVVPLDKVQAKPERSAASRPPRRVPAVRRDAGDPTHYAAPLPDGHVRKKATGEIGKIQALDPKAGTVTVRWLKSGSVSTVPLTAVSRR